MERIKNDDNTICILTTRKYIYKIVLSKYATFLDSFNSHKMTCIIENYTEVEKASIFLSHLQNSTLEWEYIETLLNKANHIINSSSYNPRVIELFLKKTTPNECSPFDFYKKFMNNLENPFSFWEEIFDGLSKESLLICLIIFISMDNLEPVGLDNVRNTFYNCLKETSNLYSCEKSFSYYISELENTIIKTYTYYSDSDALVVRFQSPAIEDYLLKFLNENIEKYGNILLFGINFLDQLIFIMDYKKVYLTDSQYEFAIKKYIENFDNWDYTWPIKGDENFVYDLPEHIFRISPLHKYYNLLLLYEKRNNSLIIEFLEKFINHYIKLLFNKNESIYYDLEHLPFVISRSIDIGISIVERDNIIEKYFDACSLITHYNSIIDFTRSFKNKSRIFIKSKKAWFIKNLNNITWYSLDYFDYKGYDYNMDTILYDNYLKDIYKNLGTKLSKSFYNELCDEFGYPYVYSKDSNENNEEKEKRNREQLKIEIEEKKLSEVLDNGYKLLSEKYNYIYLEDQEQVDMINNSKLKESLKDQLLLEICSNSYLFNYLTTKCSFNILENIFKNFDLIRDEQIFFVSIYNKFKESFPYDDTIMLFIIKEIIVLHNSSENNYIDKNKLTININKKYNYINISNIINWLFNCNFITNRKSIYLINIYYLYGIIAYYLLENLNMQNVNLYNELLKEDNFFDNNFITFILPILYKYDNNFKKLYIYPILMDFIKSIPNWNKKDYLSLYKALQIEFDFDKTNKSISSSSYLVPKFIEILEILNLYFCAYLLPVNFELIPPNFDKAEYFKDDGYELILKLYEIEDESFLSSAGFVDCALDFFEFVNNMKEEIENII